MAVNSQCATLCHILICQAYLAGKVRKAHTKAKRLGNSLFSVFFNTCSSYHRTQNISLKKKTENLGGT